MFNRRCGVSSSLCLVCCAAFMLVSGFSFGQALTMVRSGVRYAGTGASGFNGDFGPATTVTLYSPSYIVIDSNGNQFITDTLNNCVRRIDTSGNITTVAGLVTSGQGDTCNTSGNPTPTAAQGLYRPTGLAIDSANRLYIADSLHNCIRALPSGATGVANLTTVAGTCGSDPSASITPAPNGLAIDKANNLYISLQDSVSPAPVYQVVRHLANDPALNVCLMAGAPSANVATQCSGVSNGVALNRPSGLAIDISNDLFIADTGNNCVREVSMLTTQITSIGQCVNDGSGNASTSIQSPYGLAISPTQSLLISESSPDNIVSYIPGSNNLTLVAGLPNGISGSYNSTQDGKSALNSPLNNPRGIAIDNLAHIYVADSLNNISRELSFNYQFPSTPVGSGSSTQPVTFTINQNANLTATAGTDYSITSTTCSGALSPASSGAPPATCQVFVRFNPSRPGIRKSTLKLTDSISGTSIIQGLQGTGTGALAIFTPGSVVTSASNLVSPSSLATDSAGNAYVLESGQSASTPNIRKISAGGGALQSLLPSGAKLSSPSAVVSDANDNWLIADKDLGTVTRIAADGSVDASFITGLDSPVALYADIFGNLYIAQNGNSHNVIEVYASGVRRTIAGNGSNTAADGVSAAAAEFVSPSALTFDLNGSLYIADQGGHRVYAIDKAGIIHFAAGNGTTSDTVPGQATGTAILAPASLAMDAAGDLYIADQSKGIVYTLYTTSGSGNIAATFSVANSSTTVPTNPQPTGPISIALDGSANLFVANATNGTVVELIYPNPTLNFGTIMVGQTSSALLQSVANVGTDDLNINDPFSTSDSHFTIDSASTTCGTTILIGATCEIGFKFTPSTNAPYTATSTINSNSYNSPQPITLVATGKQLVTLPTTLGSETEVYGQSFPEIVNFSNITATPTGTITFTAAGKVLCSLSGNLLGSTATCTAPNSGLSVGSYTVTFNYSGDANYNPASGTVSLTVTPAPLAVTVNNATRLYGASNPVFTGSVTGTILGETILASYATTATIASPVGSYPITATLTAAGNTSLSNYTVTNTPGTLTVTQTALSVTVLSAIRQYGQPNPAFTDSIAGNLNGDTVTVTYSTTATLASPVGNYPITATIAGGAAGNYTLSVIPGTLTVTPAPLTVTVSNATRPYGQPNPAFTSTSTGALNGDSFTNTYSTPATASSPVGNYPINDQVSGLAASNYTITVVPGTLTIAKATALVTISANNASRSYGSANPQFTATITGLLSGDTLTITYTTAATLTSSVGNYPIVPAVSGPSAANYTITLANGTLTVTPAVLIVTADNATRSYGQPNPAFTGSATGLLNGDNVAVAFSTTAVMNSPVGIYPIVPVVSGAAAANYTVNAVNGTLTVIANQKSLVINVHNASRVYAQDNPAFSGTVTGVLAGDDVVVTYNTPATPTSNAGRYPIGASISGMAAGNYIATIHPGTLDVNPASTTTTASSTAATVAQGASITFRANVVASSGTASGIVNFYDGNTLLGSGTLNAAGVTTYTTSLLSLGSHIINAAFQANTNFTGSAATLNETVTQPIGSFSIAATPANQFLHGAGTTTYQIAVTSADAFAGQVALSCSGLPSDASCSFATPTVTLTAGGNTTTTMTITTTEADATLRQPAPLNPAEFAPITAAAVFPFEMTGLGVLLSGMRRRKQIGTQKVRLLVILAFSLGILGLTGCGCPNTAFKTYTVNVTGTSLSFPAPAQTTSIVLSVGQ